MLININLFDNSISNSSLLLPGQYIINIPDDIKIEKTIISKILVQKKDTNNNSLYKKIIFPTEYDEVGKIIKEESYEEVIIPSENIITYKRDFSGKIIYLDQNNNETISPTSTETKIISKPYKIMYTTITDEEGNSYIVPKTENDNIIYRYPIKNGEEIIWQETIEFGYYEENVDVVVNNIPIVLNQETVQYEPIMIEKNISKVIKLEDDYTQFTVDEILNKKFEYILNYSNFQYIYADEFVTSDDIDVFAENHGANTGIKVLELLPNGQCQTKLIQLDTPAKVFSLYFETSGDIEVLVSSDGIEFIPFVNNGIMLPDLTNRIILRFKNLNNKKVNINSYAVLY